MKPLSTRTGLLAALNVTLTAVGAVLGPAVLAPSAMAQTATPIRPPAVPLITRAPFMNVWIDNTTGNAVGTWPTFYNGNVKAITGLAYIDGKPYLFFGAPNGTPAFTNMTETSVQTTPTQSIFTFNGGGVNIYVDFLSPIEATDIRRESMPIADIIATAQSSNGANHTVSIYFDISGEWTNGDSTQLIQWNPETINRNDDGSGTSGTLSSWDVTSTNPQVLTTTNSYSDWGQVYFATATQSGLTTQSGQDTVVRSQFVSSGTLLNTNDTNQPRAIDNDWPVFAFSQSLGTVTTTKTAPFTLLLSYVRNPVVSYLGSNVAPLWTSYWANYDDMLAFAYNDSSAALTRNSATDTSITNAATAAGGSNYAALTALSLRQAFAATELVGSSSNPWLMLEEISSDSNVQTVDVCYPSFPVFLYTNPELLRYLINPIIQYTETGDFGEAWCTHDLGPTYPVAGGENGGAGENMPVEETANILIMADAYMRAVSSSEATAYAQANYSTFKGWANYLLTVPSGVSYCNALDPQYQNQTDDFLGDIAHSSNLALKGIIAVGAMGQISAMDGNTSDAQYYAQEAQSLIGQWVTLSQNTAGNHLLLTYREAANSYSPSTTSEPDTAWSLHYNEFPDKLLNTNLVPESILTEETNWYKSLQVTTGIPLDYRADTTKSDWENWTAAGFDDQTFRSNIFSEVYDFENTTPAAVASPDLYHTTSTSTSFMARPVVGGFYSLLARQRAGIQIACGNSQQGAFVADTDFSGGSASSGTTNSITTSKVFNPAPTSVYQHGRKSTCTYTIPGLLPGNSYTVRLDFCEYAATGSGQRTFDVSINGTQVLTNFDIYATAGGEYIANAQTFNATANSSGQIVLVFTTVVNNVLVAGIEVTPTPIVVAGAHTLTPSCAPGAVLDDQNGATTNGNAVVIYQENGSGGEQWTLGAAANNGWNMATLGPYCLQSSGTTSGSALELWACNGGATQDFVSGPATGGGYNFALYGYSLCMNVSGGGSANNTAVQVATCNGGTAQAWAVN